jgi:hypothetical protein
MPCAHFYHCVTAPILSTDHFRHRPRDTALQSAMNCAWFGLLIYIIYHSNPCSALPGTRALLLKQAAAASANCGTLGSPCCPGDPKDLGKRWTCTDTSNCVFYQLGGKWRVKHSWPMQHAFVEGRQHIESHWCYGIQSL